MHRLPRLPRLAVFALALAAGAAHAQPAKGGGFRAMGYTAADLARIEPTSANPYLAYLTPGAEPDLEYWTAKTVLDGFERGRTRALRGFRAAPTARYQERERALFNRNDDVATAEALAAFDTGAEPLIAVSGLLEPVPERVVSRRALDDEAVRVLDGGAHQFNPWSLQVGSGANERATSVVTASIGDGPSGATSGDVDLYQVNLTEPTYLSVAVRTPTSDLDPVMALYDAGGRQLFVKDDDAASRDPSARIFLAEPGNYFVYVWGYTAGALTPGVESLSDPRTGYGVGSTGAYELHVSASQPDADAYAVELRLGDVLAAATASPAVSDVAVYGPDGALRMMSRTDLSGLYVDGGPLLSPSELGPDGGVSVALVAPTPGTYTVVVRGEGPYELAVQGTRPGHERQPTGRPETFFVDFDGGTYYPSRDIEGTADTTTLSPLRRFLPAWGLQPSDESAVIDAVLARLRRHLRDDLRADVHGMGGLEIEILNSRDHPDPGPRPDVNRLVISGTSEELGGEGFYGIASSIDIGNYRRDDVAYILLDAFSAPPDDPSSLNSLVVDPSRTKAELVGLALGKVAAHEAGHFLGLHHTHNSNATASIIDEGGAPLWQSLDIGEDGVFGPGDGALRLRADAFQQYYPFSGEQRAPDALAHSLHTAAGAAPAADARDLLEAYRFSPAARAAAGSRAGRLALDESFDDNTGDWEQAYDDGSGSRLAGGALLLRAGPGRLNRLGAATLSQGDFAARFDVRYEGGCTTDGAGIYFRWQDGAYLSARVDAAGEAWTRISRFDGAQWTSPTDWASTSAARPGEWNAAEVVALGPSVRLFLNGQLVQEATVTPSSGESWLGLVADACDGEPIEYRFDNLTVVEFGSGAGVRSFPGPAASGAPEPASGPAPADEAQAAAPPGGVGVRGVTGGHPAAQGYVFTFGPTRVRLTEGEGEPRLWVLDPGAEVWRAARPGEVAALLARAPATPAGVATETPLSGPEAQSALDRLRELAGTE